MRGAAIGIDVGYGYTKSFTMFEDGIHRKVFTPTAVSRYIPDFSFAQKIPIIRVNSQRFAIGEDLIINSIPYENTTRKDFIGSPSYMAMLGYVLSHYNYPIRVLVTGLPPDFYKKETVEKLISTIKEQWIVDFQGRLIQIPETIKIVPQGAGIFFNLITHHPELHKENILVMDIGYHTLDLVFFSNGKYAEEMSATFNLGVKVVYDKIRKLFSQTYGTFSKDEEVLDEIIKYGKYKDFDGEYVLDVSEILQYYRALVENTIKAHIRDMTKKITYIVAGGGGTLLVKDHIKAINLIDDPQFGNAIGFFLYGKRFLEKMDH